MGISKKNFRKMLKNLFDDNRKYCAVRLKISETTVYRLLNGKGKAGNQVIGKIAKYCIKNKIDYREYIEVAI